MRPIINRLAIERSWWMEWRSGQGRSGVRRILAPATSRLIGLHGFHEITTWLRGDIFPLLFILVRSLCEKFTKCNQLIRQMAEQADDKIAV